MRNLRRRSTKTLLRRVDQVATSAMGATAFSVSRSGALVYVSGGVSGQSGQDLGPRSLVWVNRQGREEPVGAPPRAYYVPRVSPDRTRIALDIREYTGSPALR